MPCEVRPISRKSKSWKWTLCSVLVLIATQGKCHETAESSDIQTRHFFISRIRIPVHHGRVHSSNGESSVIAGDSKCEPSNSNGKFGNTADAGKAGGDYATNDGLDSANGGINGGGGAAGGQAAGGRFGGRHGGRHGGRGGREGRRGDRDPDGERDGESGVGGQGGGGGYHGGRYGGRHEGRGGRGGEGEEGDGGGHGDHRGQGRRGGRGEEGKVGGVERDKKTGTGETSSGGNSKGHGKGLDEGGLSVGSKGVDTSWGGESQGGSQFGGGSTGSGQLGGTNAGGSQMGGGSIGGGQLGGANMGSGPYDVGAIGGRPFGGGNVGGGLFPGGNTAGGQFGVGNTVGSKHAEGDIGSGQFGGGNIGGGQLGGGNIGGRPFGGGSISGSQLGGGNIGGGQIGGGNIGGGQLGGGNIAGRPFGGGSISGSQLGGGNIVGGQLGGGNIGGGQLGGGNIGGGQLGGGNIGVGQLGGGNIGGGQLGGGNIGGGKHEGGNIIGRPLGEGSSGGGQFGGGNIADIPFGGGNIGGGHFGGGNIAGTPFGGESIDGSQLGSGNIGGGQFGGGNIAGIPFGGGSSGGGQFGEVIGGGRLDGGNIGVQLAGGNPVVGGQLGGENIGGGGQLGGGNIAGRPFGGGSVGGGQFEGGNIGGSEFGGGSGQLGGGNIGSGQIRGSNTKGSELGGENIKGRPHGGGRFGAGNNGNGQDGGGNLGSHLGIGSHGQSTGEYIGSGQPGRGRRDGEQRGGGIVERGHSESVSNVGGQVKWGVGRTGGRTEVGGSVSNEGGSEISGEGGRGWADSTMNVGYGQSIDSGRKENVHGFSQWNEHGDTYGSRGDLRYSADAQNGGRNGPGKVPDGGGINESNRPSGSRYDDGKTFQGINDQSSSGTHPLHNPNGATGSINGPLPTYQSYQTANNFPSRAVKVRCRYVINREDIFNARNKPRKNGSMHEYEVTDERIAGVSYIQADGSFGPCFRVGSHSSVDGEIPQGTDQYNTAKFNAASRNPGYVGYQGNTQQRVPDSSPQNQFEYQTQVGVLSQSAFPVYPVQGSNVNIFDRPPRDSFTSNRPQLSYQLHEVGVTLPGRTASASGSSVMSLDSSPSYPPKGSQVTPSPSLPPSTNLGPQSETFNVLQVSSSNNSPGGATPIPLPSNRPMGTNYQSQGGTMLPQGSLGANTESGGYEFNRPHLGFEHPLGVSFSGNRPTPSRPGNSVNEAHYQAGVTSQSAESPYGATFTSHPSGNYVSGSHQMGISYNQPSGASFNNEQSGASHVTFGANRPTGSRYQNQYTGKGGGARAAGQESGNNNTEGISTLNLGPTHDSERGTSPSINTQGKPNSTPQRPHLGVRPTSNGLRIPNGAQGSYSENTDRYHNNGGVSYPGNSYITDSTNYNNHFSQNGHHREEGTGGYCPCNQGSKGGATRPSQERDRPQDVAAASLNGNAKLPGGQYGQHTGIYQKPQGGIPVSDTNFSGATAGTEQATGGMYSARPTGSSGSLPTFPGDLQTGNVNAGAPSSSISGGPPTAIPGNIPTIGITVLSDAISGSKLGNAPISSGAPQVPGGVVVNSGNSPVSVNTTLANSGGNMDLTASLPNVMPDLSGLSQTGSSIGGGIFSEQTTQSQSSMSGGDFSDGKQPSKSEPNVGNNQNPLLSKPTNSVSSRPFSGGHPKEDFTEKRPGVSFDSGGTLLESQPGSTLGGSGSAGEGYPHGSTQGNGFPGSLGGGVLSPISVGNGPSTELFPGGTASGLLPIGNAGSVGSLSGGIPSGSLMGGSGGGVGSLPGGNSAGSLQGSSGGGGGVSLPGASGSGGPGGLPVLSVSLPVVAGSSPSLSLPGNSEDISGGLPSSLPGSVSMPSSFSGSLPGGGSVPGMSLPGGDGGSNDGLSSGLPGSGSLHSGLSSSLPGGGSLPEVSLPGGSGGSSGGLPSGLPGGSSLPSGILGSLPGGTSLPSMSLPGSSDGVLASNLPGIGSTGISGSLPGGTLPSLPLPGGNGGSSGVLPTGLPNLTGGGGGLSQGSVGSSDSNGDSSNGGVSSGSGSGLPHLPDIFSGLIGNSDHNNGNTKPGINITFSNHNTQENGGGGLLGSGASRPGGAIVLTVPGGQTYVHRFPMRSALPVQLTPSLTDTVENPETEVIRLKRVDTEVSEMTNYKISRFDKRKFVLKKGADKMKDRVKRHGFKLHRFLMRSKRLVNDKTGNEIPRIEDIPFDPREKSSVYQIYPEVNLNKESKLRTRRHVSVPRSSVIQKIGSNPVETTTVSTTTSTAQDETTTEEGGSADCVVPVSQVCEMFDDIKDKIEGAKDLAETVGGVVFGGIGGGGGSRGSGGITGILKGAASMIPNLFASKS